MNEQTKAEYLSVAIGLFFIVINWPIRPFIGIIFLLKFAIGGGALQKDKNEQNTQGRQRSNKETNTNI